MAYFWYAVDLVIFVRFKFSLEDQIYEFKNLAKIIIILTLLEKNEKLLNLNFLKNPKIRNSWKFKHTKITGLSNFLVLGNIILGIFPLLIPTLLQKLYLIWRKRTVLNKLASCTFFLIFHPKLELSQLMLFSKEFIEIFITIFPTFCILICRHT